MSFRPAEIAAILKSTAGAQGDVQHVNVDSAVLESIELGALPCISIGGRSQKVSFDGSVASVSITSTIVRLVATKACWIASGAAPTAVADGTCMYLPADAPEYFRITSGHKIAAIKVADVGDLLITEAV